MAGPSRTRAATARAAILPPLLALILVVGLAVVPHSASAVGVSHEVGVYPIVNSGAQEVAPDVEGDIVVWQHVPEDSPFQPYDAWGQIGSNTATYSTYVPAAGNRPRLRNGRVYSLASDGLHVTDIESATSMTVPATSYMTGYLVMSDDGLATWASALKSAAIYDTNDETLTIVPYSGIPRLPNESYTWAFIQPMAAGSRLLLGGDFNSGRVRGPLSTWDSVAETRTVWGTGEYLPAARRNLLSSKYVVWVDSSDQRIHVHEFASGETTIIANSDPASLGELDMSGTRIVWEDVRNGNSDIYWYDVATGEERRLTSDMSKQTAPAIDGNRVVWADARSGNGDIYATNVVPGSPNDVVPPVTSVVTKRNADGSVSVSLTATDPAGVDGPFYSLDGGDWVEGTSLELDEPGPHHINCYSVDGYGNIEAEHVEKVLVSVPTTVTIGVSQHVVRWGESVEITAAARTTGLVEGPLGSAALRIEARQPSSGDSWWEIGTVTTNASGVATYAVCPFYTTEYRVVYDGFDGKASPSYTTGSISTSTAVHTQRSTAITVAGSRVEPGSTATTITGVLSYKLYEWYGCSLVPVSLERRVDDTWESIDTTLTEQGGLYRFRVMPTSTMTYRVVFAGLEDEFDRAESPTVGVVLLGTPMAPASMRRGKSYTVYGSLKPKSKAGTKPVRIYRWRKVNGRWRSYGSVLAKAYDYKGYSRYKTALSLKYRGRWRLRAYSSSDSLHFRTWSTGYDYVTVR